jgi:hypothetical protein
MPTCYLVREEHIPQKAAFPVIDAHNHLWGGWDKVDGIVRVMDACGVIAYADLTANLKIRFAGGGYEFETGDLSDFTRHCAERHPGRFFCFTTATFSSPVNRPLFADAAEFVARTVAMLRDHAARGARGLKILKELGLHYRDGGGALLAVDDPRFGPVWEACADLGLPVLMHQGDPAGFFEPVTPDNEHYDSLIKYPAWSFADPKYPRRRELLERRDRLFARHPRTTFLLPHGGGWPENLGYVSDLLDAHPNVGIDISARLDEFGRQPYRARELFIRHQDRILFGTDMPVSESMYRCYFRFLETYDEHFACPDYDGAFNRLRWHIHGIGLPKAVLEKIYRKNALKWIPGLRREGRSKHAPR